MGFFDKQNKATPDSMNAEVSDALRQFKERAAAETKRFADATDSEYWVAVCFHTREDKERFLAEFSLDTVGDKYLDGYEVAKILRRKAK